MNYIVRDKDGKLVREGDAVTDFRGRTDVFKKVTRGPELGMTPKVWTSGGEFYCTVYDLTVEVTP